MSAPCWNQLAPTWQLLGSSMLAPGSLTKTEHDPKQFCCFGLMVEGCRSGQAQRRRQLSFPCFHSDVMLLGGGVQACASASPPPTSPMPPNLPWPTLPPPATPTERTWLWAWPWAFCSWGRGRSPLPPLPKQVRQHGASSCRAGQGGAMQCRCVAVCLYVCVEGVEGPGACQHHPVCSSLPWCLRLAV